MFVRLLRDWKLYKAGRTLTMGDGAANVLIRRRIAAPVSAGEPGGEPPPAVEPPPAKPPKSKPKKPKKRRSRKA